jgi:hypothetical protein
VSNLLLLLLGLFASLALLVVLLERFASPVDPARMQRLQRWFMPLVGLMLLLSLIKYYV